MTSEPITLSSSRPGSVDAAAAEAPAKTGCGGHTCTCGKNRAARGTGPATLTPSR